jgi:hypothetical protein
MWKTYVLGFTDFTLDNLYHWLIKIDFRKFIIMEKAKESVTIIQIKNLML